MKGILLKDLYIAKSDIIVTLTALFVLAFGLSFLLDASSILMLAPAISTVAVYMSITNDASSKWNKNVITMPVSRDQIIGAKYILYLLLSAIGIIVVLASLGIMSLLGMTITLYSLLFNAAIGISAALFAGGSVGNQNLPFIIHLSIHNDVGFIQGVKLCGSALDDTVLLRQFIFRL